MPENLICLILGHCERGLSEFDFLGPCMDWKLDWESRLRTHTWLTIFRPTRSGRLVHFARSTAWPIVRALFGRKIQTPLLGGPGGSELHPGGGAAGAGSNSFAPRQGPPTQTNSGVN